MGNGLLTFINNETKLGDFFTNKEAVLYKNLDDLSYKINKYKRDTNDRKRIAKNGRDFYIKEFNSTIVSDFILSKTLGYKSRYKFAWLK
jgi:spore maturation protein CgeB